MLKLAAFLSATNREDIDLHGNDYSNVLNFSTFRDNVCSLVIFIGVPLIEIYLLIEVGSVIGAIPTVLAVVFTAVLGVSLIRIQGFSTLQKAQNSMAQGIPPAMEMFEGVMLLFAAICLLMPGFFTDAVGFLLLIPPFRKFLASQLIGSAILKSRFSNSKKRH